MTWWFGSDFSEKGCSGCKIEKCTFMPGNDIDSFFVSIHSILPIFFISFFAKFCESVNTWKWNESLFLIKTKLMLAWLRLCKKKKAVGWFWNNNCNDKLRKSYIETRAMEKLQKMMIIINKHNKKSYTRAPNTRILRIKPMVIRLENQSNYKLLLFFFFRFFLGWFFPRFDRNQNACCCHCFAVCPAWFYFISFFSRKNAILSISNRSTSRFDIFVAKSLFFVFWNIIEFIKFCVGFVSIYDVAISATFHQMVDWICGEWSKET